MSDKEYEEFIARLEAEPFDAMGDRDSQEDKRIFGSNKEFR